MLTSRRVEVQAEARRLREEAEALRLNEQVVDTKDKVLHPDREVRSKKANRRNG